MNGRTRAIDPAFDRHDPRPLEPASFDPGRAGLHPRCFSRDAVDPATAQLNEAIEKILALTPPIHSLKPAEIRAARERGEGIWGPVVTVDDARVRRIPGPAGEIGIRVIAPPSPRGVYLHFHGGGWALGAAHHQDVPNKRLSAACDMAVVSVDYRLAPEDPYPAAPDDCEAAALWLVEHAEREFGTRRLLIGGESAGAHLSVVTLLRLRTGTASRRSPPRTCCSAPTTSRSRRARAAGASAT